jgi:hypothetical protein
MDAMEKIDEAEMILRNNDCRITSFLSSGTTQYVVKKHKMSISPSYLSIKALCDWIINNEKHIEEA